MFERKKERKTDRQKERRKKRKTQRDRDRQADRQTDWGTINMLSNKYEVKLTNSNIHESNTLSNMSLITHSFTPHTSHPHTPSPIHGWAYHVMSWIWGPKVCPPGVYCQRCKAQRNFHFVSSVPCADISTKFYYTTQPKPNGWEAANMYNVTYWIAGFMMYVCMLLEKKKDLGRRFPINMVYRE